MTSDTHARSLLKAISWRATGTMDTFLISWLITGELMLAGGIAGTEVLTKITLFYLHERAWSNVRWGRRTAAEVPAPAAAADAQALRRATVSPIG